MFYIFTVMYHYMVFLMHIIYSFSSLRWFTTYRFCPKQLLMLLRVTPLIQSILQNQEYDFNMLVDHSGARYTTWVSAVNRKLSAIKHALRAKKMLKYIALSFVEGSIVVQTSIISHSTSSWLFLETSCVLFKQTQFCKQKA